MAGINDAISTFHMDGVLSALAVHGKAARVKLLFLGFGHFCPDEPPLSHPFHPASSASDFVSLGAS